MINQNINKIQTILENNLYQNPIKTFFQNKKEIIVLGKKKKGYFYLSKKYKVNYESQGQRIIIAGTSGYGKTFTGAGIFAQFPSGMFLDRKGKTTDSVYDSLKKISRIINENLLEKVEFYKITTKNDKERLTLNVKDLNPEFLQMVFSTKSSTTIQRKLIKFFSKTNNKNYNGLRDFCEKNKLDMFWYDIKKVLDENDEGMDIIKLQTKKTIIDYNEAGSQSVIPGVILGTIFALRREYKNLQKPFIFAVDEVQERAKANTALGSTLSSAFSVGRSYNISSMAIGTNPNKLAPEIKNNISILLLFNSVFNIDKFRHDYSVDLNADDLQYLLRTHKGVGNFFYFNFNEGIVSSANGKNLCRLDCNYLKTKTKTIIKKIPDYTQKIINSMKGGN